MIAIYLIIGLVCAIGMIWIGETSTDPKLEVEWFKEERLVTYPFLLIFVTLLWLPGLFVFCVEDLKNKH